MRRTLPQAFALAAGLLALACAQTPSQAQADASAAVQTTLSSHATAFAGIVVAQQPGAPAPFRQGQAVVVVGQVSSAPKQIAGVREEQKMQVAIGPGKVDYTLHMSDAALFGASGQKIQANDLMDKQWIRAEGTVMDDPRRIKVTKLQVVGKDAPDVQRSAFYRSGFDQGYVMAVAGTRQIFPETPGAAYNPAPLVIVGKVSDDTGPLETTRKIQVDAAGNTWTVHVSGETPVVSAKGEKISVHEVAKGQWIRVHGWQTDDLRLRAARIENVGPEEAFRASTLYRASEPIGYVERTPGTGVEFKPVKLMGVITAIDSTAGVVTIRDEGGTDRKVWIETVVLTADGRPVDIKTLRQGQRVTVEGSEIKF